MCLRVCPGRPWIPKHLPNCSLPSVPLARAMLSLSLNHLPRPKPVGTFRGHSEIVWSVGFLPNGKALVSASNDGSIRLWNLDHESEVILGSSNSPVFCLALFPDGKRLASGGLDRSINVWDIDILAAVDGPWKGHTSSVRYLDISSDCRYLASGSFDHKVNVWDTESGQIVRDQGYLRGDGKINCVKFSKKACRLLTGSGDGCLRIWDWESGELLVGPMQADEMPIWALAWSRNETQILSGSSDGVLRRWHASTGHIVGEPVDAHTSIIYSLSVSHNGGCLASASSDNTVKIWNATTFELMAVLPHPDEVNCITFSTDDRLLATACSDSAIYIWELPQASLDSGLVIDRECDGASLLEVSLTGSAEYMYYSELLSAPDGHSLGRWCRSGPPKQHVEGDIGCKSIPYSSTVSESHRRRRPHPSQERAPTSM